MLGASVSILAHNGMGLVGAFAAAVGTSKRAELATADIEFKLLGKWMKINWLKQAVNVNHSPQTAAAKSFGVPVVCGAIGALAGFANHGSNFVGVGFEIASSAGAAEANGTGF